MMNRRLVSLLFMALASIAAGCSEPRTQIIAVIDADSDELKERINAFGLTMRTFDFDDRPQNEAVSPIFVDKREDEWPFEIALTTETNAADRYFILSAVAYEGGLESDGSEPDDAFLRVITSSGFVEGERRYMKVLFTDGCTELFEECEERSEDEDGEFYCDPNDPSGCRRVTPVQGTDGLCSSVNCDVFSPDAGVDADAADDADEDADETISANCDTVADCPAAANADGARCRGNECSALCVEGFEDCDEEYLNGCEATLDTDDNCGECGNRCSGPNRIGDCSAGVCNSLCTPGYADCNPEGEDNENNADGCETSTTADAMNCGGCGIVCQRFNTVGSCQEGTCVFECADGFADCDGDLNNGCEVEIANDLSNCGSCGSTCSVAGGVAACTDGFCGVASCAPGRADCDNDPFNGCETDLTDSSNCGVCGTVCGGGDVCDASNIESPMCASGCGSGTQCGSSCIDTSTNPSHCGGCDAACDVVTNGESTCSSGSCSFECSMPFANCGTDDCSTNTDSDSTNCGSCGNECEFTNGIAGCSDGSCTLQGCMPGFADCDGNPNNGCEVSTSDDESNCGACDNSCPSDGGSASCEVGVCTIECSAGSGNCDGEVENGCETNVDADPMNCGGCGSVCNLPRVGSYTCDDGDCGVNSCETGWGNCDGNEANGCETNLFSDAENCGACDNDCPGSQTCTGGMCSATMCDPGFADCDGDPANDCEVDLSDDDNCGACDFVCNLANAESSCSSSGCVITMCADGFSDCDMNPANGCEVDITTNSNCGVCGKTCSAVNATVSCDGASGSCEIDSCALGFDDCDGSFGNGCEINVNTSLSHCGECNSACALDNATATCTAGACGIDSCDGGYDDCDRDPMNGCEVDITTNDDCGECDNACDAGADLFCNGSTCAQMCTPPLQDCSSIVPGCETNTDTNTANCGGCGSPCRFVNGVGACSGGSCSFSGCNGGFGNCDGSLSNGCEVNTNTSLAHCGACNAACSTPNAVPKCAAGSCAINRCLAGFNDCNSDPSDGCEINRLTDPLNCGACGTECDLTNVNVHTCTGGSCGVGTCDAGYANCDGNAANGCEAALGTDVNCGSCGDSCGAGETCQGGSCSDVMCPGSTVDCDSNGSCETDISNDPNNCNACGNICNLPGTDTHSCASGTCLASTCDSGFDDCDNDPANGCEANTNTDLSNCGGCGLDCDLANVNTPLCASGSCQIGSCETGFADCDNAAVNGCEINTKTNVNHCNGCGMVCTLPNATPLCADSACVVGNCTSPFEDCDGNAMNGCEANTNTNPAHCGGCGASCSLSNVDAHTCDGATCGIGNCSDGYADCDGAASNGCEVDILNDSGNCGMCGMVCTGAGATCNGGTCSTMCVPTGAPDNTNCGPSCVDCTTSNQACGWDSTSGATGGFACGSGEVCNRQDESDGDSDVMVDEGVLQSGDTLGSLTTFSSVTEHFMEFMTVTSGGVSNSHLLVAGNPAGPGANRQNYEFNNGVLAPNPPVFLGAGETVIGTANDGKFFYILLAKPGTTGCSGGMTRHSYNVRVVNAAGMQVALKGLPFNCLDSESYEGAITTYVEGGQRKIFVATPTSGGGASTPLTMKGFVLTVNTTTGVLSAPQSTSNFAVPAITTFQGTAFGAEDDERGYIAYKTTGSDVVICTVSSGVAVTCNTITGSTFLTPPVPPERVAMDVWGSGSQHKVVMAVRWGSAANPMVNTQISTGTASGAAAPSMGAWHDVGPSVVPPSVAYTHDDTATLLHGDGVLMSMGLSLERILIPSWETYTQTINPALVDGSVVAIDPASTSFHPHYVLMVGNSGTAPIEGRFQRYGCF